MYRSLYGQTIKESEETTEENTTEVREVSRRVIGVTETRGEASGSSSNVTQNVTVREIRGGTTDVSGGEYRYQSGSQQGGTVRGGTTTSETTETTVIRSGAGGAGAGAGSGAGAGGSMQASGNADFRFGGNFQTTTTEVRTEVVEQQQVVQGGGEYREAKIASGSGGFLDYPTQQRLKDAFESHKYIRIALYIGIILSIINICLGIGIGAQFSATIAGFVVGAGVFSLAVFIAGLFIVKTYVDRCEEALLSNDLAKCEAVDQSWERTLLNIWLYMVMIIFLIFLIAVIACFGFKDEARYAVDAASRNQATWNRYFGDRTYEYISSNITTLLNVAGFFALLLVIYCAVLLAFSFRLLGAYRTFQTVMEFICLLFFCFGFGFLYLAIYSQRYRDVAKVDKAMPSWVPDALLASAIISIIVAIVGYVSIYLENKQYIKFFGIGALVFTCLILIFAIGGFVFAAKLDTYFEGNCNNVLDYLSEDYLVTNAGCNKKYIFTSGNIDTMKCPKDRIVSAWEQNLGKNLEDQTDAYGCLDSECCYKTFAAIKSKVDYLAIIATILFILGVLLTIGCFFMFRKLDSGIEHGIGKNAVNKAMLIVAVVVAIIMLIFIFMIPSPPELSPTYKVKVEKSTGKATAVYVPSVIPNINRAIKREEEKNIKTITKETMITQDLSKCTDTNTCPKLRYSFDLVTNDGSLALSEAATNSAAYRVTNNKLEDNGEYWLKFYGDASTLNNYVSAINFIARCPLQRNVARLRVSAEAIAHNAALIQTSMHSFLQLNNKMKQEGGSSTSKSTYTYSSYSSTGGQAPESSSYTYESETTTEAPTTTSAASFNVDPSTLKVGDRFDIFDKVLDYSMISNTPVTVRGRILSAGQGTNTPVAGSTVTFASQEFPNCAPVTVTSGADGKFTSTPLNILEGNLPGDWAVTIKSAGFSDYTRKFEIGGMGFEQDHDLGDIIIWSPDMQQSTTVQSLVINSLTNQPESGVTVKLFKGDILVENELANQPQAMIQMSQVNAAVTVQGVELQTGTDGKFSFSDLLPSTYTFVIEKEGFYREVRSKYILTI
jgi:hypothetical protein